MTAKMEKEHQKMVNISAHIPLALAQRLEKIAKLEERTKSYYVKKSLEEYLEDIEDYLTAERGYKEYVATGGKNAIGMDEMLKQCDLTKEDINPKKFDFSDCD